jgi:hypothetical protein
MDRRIEPLPYAAGALRGLSEKLVASHHRNNYCGGVRRLIALVTLSGGAMATPVDFDADAIGRAPVGWTCGATGGGAPKWTVEADARGGKGHVLRQSGRAPFPWCVKDETAISDGWVEVRFRAISGREDQAGGLVWRWKDGDNYYVARANALENNVSLYHTTAGKRHTIEYKDAPVTHGMWHTLRVEFKGHSIRVLFDGKPYIERADTHIAGPGKVGVWTKADSVTEFGSFTYGDTPR